MHVLVAGLLLIAACHRADEARAVDDGVDQAATEPARPAVVPIAPVTPVVPVAPAVVPVAPVPAFGPPVRLARRDFRTLCAYDAAGRERCRMVEAYYDDKAPQRGHHNLRALDAPARNQTALTRDGVACTLSEDRLACGGGAAHAIRLHWGYHLFYVEDAGRWSWFEPGSAKRPGDPLELHALALPAEAVQVAIGFRVGCARTATGEVHCWSDPRRPRRIRTPPNVVDLALQAPFELCVRTAAGEVHCTPPYVQAELVCSADQLACGTGSIVKPELTTSFDPVVKLQRPLQRIALGHVASVLEADDAPIYEAALDAIVVGPSIAGACMLGGGRVSCMSACGGRWRVGEVSGLPGNVSRIWSEEHTGYALADGALYWWKRNSYTNECDPSLARQATRMTGLPARVVELVEPLEVTTGPQRHEHPRCVLGAGGEVRCWLQDLEDGHPLELFDPIR